MHRTQGTLWIRLRAEAEGTDLLVGGPHFSSWKTFICISVPSYKEPVWKSNDIIPSTAGSCSCHHLPQDPEHLKQPNTPVAKSHIMGYSKELGTWRTPVSPLCSSALLSQWCFMSFSALGCPAFRMLSWLLGCTKERGLVLSDL